MMSIVSVGAFDMDYLDYFNFLEALVRVCNLLVFEVLLLAAGEHYSFLRFRAAIY